MKKAPLIIFLSLLASVFCFSNAYTSDYTSDAVSMANIILRQPVSARTLALADAFTGLTDDINAISYNPAGLARLTSSEMATMYSEQPDVSYGFFGLSFHFSDKFNLGFSGKIRNNGETEQNYVYTLSYALKIMETPDVGITTVGFNIRYLENNLTEEDKIYTYVGDIGLLSTLFIAEKPFGIGLCIQNYGGEIIHENGVYENGEEKELLPLVARGGIAYTFGTNKENPISISADVTYVENELQPKYSAGMEYWLTPGFAMRIGYKVNYDVDSLTAGIGLKYGAARFDYALVVLDNTVGYTPKISFLCKF